MTEENHGNGGIPLPCTIEAALCYLDQKASNLDKANVLDAWIVTVVDSDFGRWISNAFGLWGFNELLLKDIEQKFPEAVLSGKIGGFMHPYDACTVIVNQFKERLQCV